MQSTIGQNERQVSGNRVALGQKSATISLPANGSAIILRYAV